MKASLLIEAKDNASAVFGRIAGNAKKMGAGFKPVASGIAAIGTKALAPLNRADRFLTQFNRNLRKTGVYADVAKRGAIGLGRGMVTLGGNIAGAAVQWAKWAALAGVGAFVLAAKSTIELAANFEVLTSELEAVEKSSLRARIGMKWVRDFAVSSVLPLQDLAEAYVLARKSGIDPMTGYFAAFADQAVASKQSILDVVKAVGEAKIGDFGGLNNFGIEASKAKGVATFTFLDKFGKRTSKSVVDNAAKIETALTEIFRLKSMGKAEAKAKTFIGLWAQLKNMGTGFQLDVANAGIFDLIKAKAQGFLTKMQGFSKDGTLAAWAEKISDRLEEAVDWASEFVENTNWTQVGNDIKSVAGAVGTAVSALAKLVTLYQKLRELADKPISVAGIQGKSFSQAANQTIKSQAPVVSTMYGAANLWLAGPSKKAAPRARALPMKSRKTASADVGGRLDINISAPKGYAAKVTKMASNNPNVEMRTGKVRRG